MSHEGQGKKHEGVNRALQHFVGMSENQIQNSLLQTLEGHLRAILGTLTVDEIYKERDMFASKVQETATLDMAQMGLTILSFTIKDVYDNVDYLNSLGKARTAEVVADADIGIAQANRDAEIQESICTRETTEARNLAGISISNAERDFKTQNAGFEQEIQQRKAQVDNAHPLKKAKLQQNVTNEELEIINVQRKREIEVAAQEVLRKEKELQASVYRPAEAKRFQTETVAEGEKNATIFAAQGEAESIRLEGAAEARVTLAVGEAEAEAMKVKADAYKAYGDAAIMSMVLESLPAIAAEISAPLERTSEIVMVGQGDGDGVSGEVGKLMGSLPPVVGALSGIDLNKAVKGMMK